LCQTFRDYEIIVVDDGSADNTREILKRYGDKINYIYQDNSGVSGARNTGIRHACGEWLAFLDSDDEWKADYLYKQMERVRENLDICMQTADCLFIGLNGDTRRYFEINGSLAEFHGKEYLFLEKPFRFVVKHGPWQIGSTIIRREAITKAGLFDTSLTLSEDFDLMARVALQGPFGMIREELVHVYRRDESTACLTNQVEENPIQARESLARIYENLKKIDALNHKEQKALNELLSANRRAIGNLLLEGGKAKEARDYYTRSFAINPSPTSLARYLLSFFPSKWSLWIIEKNTNWRVKKR
jgi:glycosyltransferase involved in cell wall biosynthesis